MGYKFVSREEVATAIKIKNLAYLLRVLEPLLAEREACFEFMKTLPLPIEVAEMEVARIVEEKSRLPDIKSDPTMKPGEWRLESK